MHFLLLHYFASSFIGILQCQRMLAKEKTFERLSNPYPQKKSSLRKVTLIFLKLSLMKNQICNCNPSPSMLKTNTRFYYACLVPSLCHVIHYLSLITTIVINISSAESTDDVRACVAVLRCYKSFQILIFSFYVFLIVDW